MSMVLRYRGTGGSPFAGGPIKHHASCKWKIIIDESSLHTLRGTLQFFKLRPNLREDDIIHEFHSLRIQLEGIIKTRFQSKIDSRVQNLHQEIQFLPLDESDFPSPFVFHFIRDGQPTDPQFSSQGPALHSFPFEIELYNFIQNFPASFCTALGSIQYKLSVYTHTQLCEDIVVRIPAFLNGYFNFAAETSFNDSVNVTSELGTNFQFFRPKLKCNLIVNQKGFLPGETIGFRLQVDNPNGDVVQKIQVAIIQQVIYSAQMANKQTFVALDQKQIEGFDTVDLQVEWEEVLQLPENLMPSFRPPKNSIEIVYFVQFSVTVRGKSELRGKARIVIGTTRDGGEEEGAPSFDANLLRPSAPSPSPVMRRRSAESGAAWGHFLEGGHSLSRPSSMDLLPPSYDEVVRGMDSWNEEIRPRCNSNVM